MNREIILRVRGPEGQYRVTVGSRDTYGELLIQVPVFLYQVGQEIKLSDQGSHSVEGGQSTYRYRLGHKNRRRALLHRWSHHCGQLSRTQEGSYAFGHQDRRFRVNLG